MKKLYACKSNSKLSNDIVSYEMTNEILPRVQQIEY